MKYLYTKEGFEVFKKLRIQGISSEQAKEIIAPLDNTLGTTREILRQYKMCYGDSHNWIDAQGERIKIAIQALEEAKEGYETLRYHNL